MWLRSSNSLAARLLWRIVQIAGTLLAVSIIVFIIQMQIPGDAAQIRVGPRQDLTTAQRTALVAQVRKELGLDKPAVVRYVLWLGAAVRLDFGTTLDGQNVTTVIGARLWPSLEVGLAGLVLSLPVAILLALLAVRYEQTVWSGAIRSLLVTGFVVPSFWIGILLVLLCAVWLHLLPASGYVPPGQNLGQHLQHLILPAVTLAISLVAVWYRYIEQGLRTAMRSQYVRTARMKGLGDWFILYRHALPNAILPALTIFGIVLGGLIGGVIIIENVFAWPGVGALLLSAIGENDYNTVVAIVLCTAGAYVVTSMGVDLLYYLLDPRTRRA